MGKLTVVKLSAIRENQVALRTVNRESEDYIGLVDSIRQKGFFGAITVREKTDPESEEVYYELVDGLHRFIASQDAGLEAINVDIIDLDDGAVLEAQIMANVHKVETRPIEYTQQLKKILNLSPLMTESELAERLGKSPQWIKQRLGLLKIENKDIQALIDEGKISLVNAYSLAKLPPEEMSDFVDRAMTQNPDEFVPVVNARVKEIREAKRKGKDAGAAEFQPRAFMQKLVDIKSEYDSSSVGPRLVATNKVATPVAGFALGVAWVLHLDPASIEEQKQKDEERKKQREEAKKRSAAERATKKAKEAAEAAEKTKAAVAALDSAK